MDENDKLRYLIGTVYPITELEHENWFENRMLEKITDYLLLR